MSAAKRPRPVTSGRSSSRGTRAADPTMLARSAVTFTLPAHFVGRRAHRLDDVLVAGAAAEIGREHVEQVLVADVGLALEHAGREHQEARRAEAALQPVMLDEGALQRMQLVALREPLDGADRLAVGLHREHQAGAHRLAVDDAPCRRRRRRARSRYACRSARNRRGWRRPASGAARRGSRGAAVDGERDVVLSVMPGSFLPAAAPRGCAAASPEFRRSHAKRRQRIVDRVENRRRRADGAALAEALGFVIVASLGVSR